MHRLAIYDMDKTITRTATFTPFLLHAATALAPWRLALAPATLGPLALYAAGRITRGRLKEITGRLLLGSRRTRAELAPVVQSFAERVVRLDTYPSAITRIEADRAAGRRLVLATASFRLYVEAIAERLGFDDVIATGSLEGLDGRVSTTIDGENCYGPAKLAMIEAWMARQGIARADAHIRFYSDHVSDAPVLEWADEPFAATPSAALRHLAAERGWPVLDWR